MSIDDDHFAAGPELNGCSESFAMSHAEIAAVLGCSRSRVQQIEALAIAKLRAALGSTCTMTMQRWGALQESTATKDRRRWARRDHG